MPDPLAGLLPHFCASRGRAFPWPYRARPARAMEAAWLCYLLMRRRHDQHDYGAAIRYADTLLS
jgi:hypothetical protein